MHEYCPAMSIYKYIYLNMSIEKRSLFMHEYCPDMSIYKCIYLMMSIEKRGVYSCMNIVLPCLSINVYIV